jgi:signal transduction histidine kinase/streptogramin lyase
VSPGGELTRVMELTAAGYIGPGRSGATWLLVDGKFYQLGSGTVGKEQRLPPGSELTGVRHVHEDTKNGLWVASSRQGLFRYAGEQLTRVTSYTSVACVVEDREGNVWVTTDGGGVGQLREKSCRLLNTTHGLAQDTVSSLAEDAAGGVWLANRSGGVYRVDGDGQVRPSGLQGARRFANVVNADTAGAIWFGGGRNGLFKWQPGNDPPEQLPSPASDLHVLYRAKNGDMWFAADGHAVGYYRDGKFHPLDSSLPGLHLIRTIAEDGFGNIWLGGRQGELLCWRDGKIELYNERRGFPRAPVHAIHVDSENRVWVGTAEGLVVKRGESFSLLTEANGLRDDIIEEVVGDQFGCLWFASRRGIFYAEIADLLRATDDAADLIDSHYLGANQGLFGLSPTPNYHPGSLRARDGTLWFATAQGALVVDPVRLPRALPPVPVVIDEVLADGTVLDLSKPIRLASGRHRVEFRFAALSYAAPETVALRHQLEGVDLQWVATPADRLATYTNLPPGEYRLRVIARNSSGQWNTDELALPLAVIPAWWETWTFKIVAVMFLIVAVATIARKVAQRRLKQRLRLLEQQQALEKERSRIARDLHDELGASLTEVGLLADRLAESAPNGFAPQLSGLAWRTRRLATDLSGIVWTMNARHASLDQLALFLRRYTERLFRNTGIRCVVEGVERIPAVPLPPDVQHHLLAVTKEALNNILMHARATETRIQLQFLDGVFQVQIRDNGVGYSTDPSGRAFDGNGLRNIRSRIVEIGGTAELTSAPGAGTVVTFQVPFVTSPEPK